MTKASPLADFHRRNGATLAERDGWLMADHFGAIAPEYQSVRGAVGLIDLSNRALLRFTGADRLAFLQGILSNDLRPLKMFDGQQAALLTQQGKVIADLRVLCAMNSYYLDFWEPLKEKVLTHINRYLVADEVEIADPSDDWKTLSLQGPGAEALLKELLGNGELPVLPNQHAMVQFDGSPICVVRANRFIECGFDLIVATAALGHVAERLTESAKSRAGRWVGTQAQEILRVEAGVPRYGVDFSEDNLLLEVGLENAVSFNKGCYLGQEVVERIRSRGHVNKRLCGLALEDNEPARAGDAIMAGATEVGKITSSVLSPALNRPISLGYLHKDHWTPGMSLTVRGENGILAATVSALPFVAGSTSRS